MYLSTCSRLWARVVASLFGVVNAALSLAIVLRTRDRIAAVLIPASLTTVVLSTAALTARPAAAQSPSSTQVYQIKSVPAADLASRLQRQIAGHGTVAVDSAHNRLIVQATPSVQHAVGQLLQRMDVPPASPAASGPSPGEQPAPQSPSTRPLQQPPNVSRQTQQPPPPQPAFGQPTQPPRRSPMPQSIRTQRPVATVKSWPVPPQRVAEVAARLQQAWPPESGVRISADPRGQLLVSANPEQQSRIASQVNVIVNSPAPEAAQPARPQVTRSAAFEHPLKHLSAHEFEGTIRRLWGKRLQVTVEDEGRRIVAQLPSPTAHQPPVVLRIDRVENQVSVVAGESDRENWQRLLNAIDRGQAKTDDQTSLVPLVHAEPAQITRTVSLLKERAGADESQKTADNARRIIRLVFQRGSQPGGQNQPAAQDAPTQDAPTQDAPTQDAPAQNQPAIPDEAGVQNQPAQDNQPPVTQPNATPIDEGLIGDVQVEVIPELGVIVLRGNKGDVERVMAVIEEIEKQSVESRPEIEVYHLRHANSAALGETITELYGEIFTPRTGNVSITPLVKPNALLLIGRRESMASAIELIRKLDQPVNPATQMRVFRLKHASAPDIEQKITTFYAERVGMDTRVRVVSDFRSNAVVVQASPRDLVEIARLIESFDVGDTPSVNEVRVFRLRNTLAATLAPLLQSAIQGNLAGGTGATQGGTTAEQLRSAALELSMIDAQNDRVIRSGILADVRVSADENGNALVVTGPAASMELIGKLIEQLDTLPDAESQIKVFTIVNGDATNLTIMLQQLFGQAVTAGTGTTGSFTVGGALSQANQQTAAAGNESSLVPLRFAVDVRTNSIIATGSIGDLAVVEALLLRLDEGDIETRKLIVYRLKNAPALDVSNSITSFLQSQRALIEQQLLFNQAISPFEQIEREVIVVPEIVTNSLIVSATPRYYDQIVEMIEKLDFRPPMVMVQVLIAEVLLSDDYEFGIEMGLQDALLFDRSSIVDADGNPVNRTTNTTGGTTTVTDPTGFLLPGFNFNNQPFGNSPSAQSLATAANVGSQGLTHFALNRLSDLGYGGLVLSASSESVSFLLRALKEDNRLQILSRPQIMTLDTQQAFVQVGQDVARITGTNLTNGILQTQVEDVQTGLILRIQPRINQDGIVVMNLDAERSQLSTTVSTPIGTDALGNQINSPAIDRTTAQTTLSAHSGQTVVFAGLIAKRKELRSRRVPHLSKIPLIGELFKYDKTVERRSELLIVMTPYIIDDDGDYEFIKQMESERMSWCLADVIEMHGDYGLAGYSSVFCDPGQSGVIYPDQDPTGSRFWGRRRDSLQKTQSHAVPMQSAISHSPEAEAASQNVTDYGPSVTHYDQPGPVEVQRAYQESAPSNPAPLVPLQTVPHQTRIQNHPVPTPRISGNTVISYGPPPRAETYDPAAARFPAARTRFQPTGYQQNNLRPAGYHVPVQSTNPTARQPMHRLPTAE